MKPEQSGDESYFGQMSKEAPDLIRTRSPFPCHDELGRVLCKNCGLPYQSWTIRGILEKQPLAQAAAEHAYNCVRCRKLSVFASQELFGGRYSPQETTALRLPGARAPGLIRDKTGQLKCQSCGKSAEGFTVKGALALLDQSDQPVLWISCVGCREISGYSTGELRSALPESPITELKPGEDLNGWCIRQVLRGGMSTVYVCETPSGILAVKTLRPELAKLPGAEGRFRREAEAWVLLGSHPHIAEALMITEDKGRSMIVTRYQSGGSLDALIGTAKFTLAGVVTFGIQFCLGMQHAHKVIPGFVHRDIKPANILIGADTLFKIADFGLVKFFDDSDMRAALDREHAISSGAVGVYRTRSGRAGGGTLPYMAPEQFEDFSSADVRTDIYAFGVVVFEILTGRLPIKPASHRAEDWYHAHLSSSVPDIREYDSSIPGALADLVKSCLAKHHSDRPEHFGLILERFREIESTQNLTIHFGISTEQVRNLKNGLVLSELAIRPEKRGQMVSAVQEATDDVGRLTFSSLDLLRPFALMRVGHVDDALAYAEHIIRVASASDDSRAAQYEARGHTFRAIALKHKNRPADAILALETALRVNPKDPLALYERGWFYNHAGNFRAALECLNKSRTLDPSRKGVAFEIGFAYNALADYPAAVTALRSEIDREPEDFILHREIAYAYLHSDQLDLAKEYYERGLSFCPTGEATQRAEMAANLAQVCARSGDMTSADKWFREAWLIAPKGSEIHSQLSCVVEEKRRRS
jgi:serine/threonine protein kinase/Tfp pilus assembly protein PilF